MVNRQETRSHIAPREKADPGRLTPASFSRSRTALNDDDVIATLANMPENRRARQVSEWEKMYIQAFRVGL